MDKNIVINFLEQDLCNFEWDKSEGIKISTKLHYSLSVEDKAEKHDLDTKNEIKGLEICLKY